MLTPKRLAQIKAMPIIMPEVMDELYSTIESIPELVKALEGLLDSGAFDFHHDDGSHSCTMCAAADAARAALAAHRGGGS